MRSTAGEVLDVLALGVQRVRGDHHPGQVQAVQGVEQRGERGDLAALARDCVRLELTEHDPGLLVDHREQMTSRTGGAS